MISIDITKDPVRIVSKGHATGAGLAGANLVCCAVSTLMYTLLSAADEKGIVSSFSMADGFMDITLERDDGSVGTVLSGLESLASQYPAYITIRKEHADGG